jgi:hypothetical protein
MADLSVTAANARPVVVKGDFPAVASVALTSLTPVYLDGTTGKAAKGDASAAGTAGVVGLAARAVGADGGVTILGNGSIVAGIDLSGLSYGDRVYLSDTAGALADAAGTVSVCIGRVIPGLASTTYDKLLLVWIEHVATTA